MQAQLRELLQDLATKVRTELSDVPQVVTPRDSLNIEDLPISQRKWYRVDDAVAVVADMKNSTQLGVNKWAASTASIYESSTGSIVQIFNRFNADFIAIQGDGAFALFWDSLRYEKALCAGITIKTFNQEMVRQLTQKWPHNLPPTGLKVGIASSTLLAKKIGTPRKPAEQEPVWAGKAVNYATKAAQGAQQGDLVVTGGVWDKVRKNDYLHFTCPCGRVSTDIWKEFKIDKLPENDSDSQGRLLTSIWCDKHGEEYCEMVLSGESQREDVPNLQERNLSLMGETLRHKNRQNTPRFPR